MASEINNILKELNEKAVVMMGKGDCRPRDSIRIQLMIEKITELCQKLKKAKEEIEDLKGCVG